MWRTRLNDQAFLKNKDHPELWQSLSMQPDLVSKNRKTKKFSLYLPSSRLVTFYLKFKAGIVVLLVAGGLSLPGLLSPIRAKGEGVRAHTHMWTADYLRPWVFHLLPSFFVAALNKIDKKHFLKAAHSENPY